MESQAGQRHQVRESNFLFLDLFSEVIESELFWLDLIIEWFCLSLDWHAWLYIDLFQFYLRL